MKKNNNENNDNSAKNNENIAAAAATTTTTEESPEDKFKKFEGDGVVFKAKLVGTELVMEPRGDKMCQNSIERLKAIIKGQKAHKRRIVMKISYLGVKIYDEKTNEILHHHEVPQISFIASDDTDTRTFGYVCDVPSKAHQFICFKTSGPAIQVMSVISSLFEAVLEKKNNNKKKKEAGEEEEEEVVVVVVESKEAKGASKESRQIKSDSSQDGNKMKDKDTNNKNSASKLTKVDSLTGDLDGLEFVTTPTPPVHFAGFDLTARSNTSNMSQVSPFGGPQANTQQHLQQQPLKSSQSGLDLVSDQLGYLVLGGPTSANNNNNNNNGSNNNIYHSSAGPQTGGHPRQPLASSASVDSTYGSSSNTTTNSSCLSHNDSTDKYAVFNDIENLPSIFESTTSLNSLGGGGGGGGVNMSLNNGQQQQQPFQSTYQQVAGNSNKPGMFNMNRSNSNISASAASQPFGAHFGGAQQQQQQQHNQFNHFNPVGGFEQHQQPHSATSTSQVFFPSAGFSPAGPNPAPLLQAPNQHTHPHTSAFHQNQNPNQTQFHQFQAPAEPSARQQGPPPPATPSMMVPTSSSSVAFRPLSHSSSSGLIVGSAPMSGHQMSQHARFSSSMVGTLHQRLGSSAASVQSIGSAGGLSRQTNPFDDDFFA